jgi:hypothetical protein
MDQKRDRIPPGRTGGAGEIGRGRIAAAAAIVTLIAYLVLAQVMLGAANPSASILSPHLFDPVQLVGLLTLVLVVGAGMSSSGAMATSIALVLGFLGLVFLVTWRLALAIAAAPRRREELRRQRMTGRR